MQENLLYTHLPAFLCSLFLPNPILDLLLQAPRVLWCVPQASQVFNSMANSTPSEQPLFSTVASLIFSNVGLLQPTATTRRLYALHLPGIFVFIFHNPGTTW